MNKLFTFTCTHCLSTVTEKLSPIDIKFIETNNSGCCEACCATADIYFSSNEYQMFEDAEESSDY